MFWKLFIGFHLTANRPLWTIIVFIFFTVLRHYWIFYRNMLPVYSHYINWCSMSFINKHSQNKFHESLFCKTDQKTGKWSQCCPVICQGLVQSHHRKGHIIIICHRSLQKYSGLWLSHCCIGNQSNLLLLHLIIKPNKKCSCHKIFVVSFCPKKLNHIFCPLHFFCTSPQYLEKMSQITVA